MKGFAIACGLLASTASAHIQMSKPYPLRSPLNKDASGQKDYSYTNPLSTDGSDYPCKGYAKDDFQSVADYSPGGEYELELEGSAVHGGGSCQIGLSYDQGETFRVIHSMLGGCPVTKNYKFTVPDDAKSGEALLSWTWFNKVGNREMYMNCAQVTIKGDSHGTEMTSLPTMPEDDNDNDDDNMDDLKMGEMIPDMPRSIFRRDSFDSLPEVFVANINGPGQCTTIEGEETNFPEPGPSVEGELSGKGYSCKSNAPFLGDSHAAASPAGSSSAAAPSSSKHVASSSAHMMLSSAATPSSTPLKSMATPSSMVASSFGTPSVPLSLPTEAADYDRTAQHPWGCRDGSIICAPDGHHWAMCDHGHPTPMGPVAAGTVCRHGAIVPAW